MGPRSTHISPNAWSYAHALSREPTFAGLETLVPRVGKVRVALLSTLLEPRTSTGATRELAAVVGNALGTRGRDTSGGGTLGTCAHFFGY